MWVAGLPACLLACLPRPGGPAGISLLPAQLPARLLTCLADPKPTEGVQSNLKRIKTGEQWDGTQRCCRLPPCLPACLPLWSGCESHSTRRCQLPLFHTSTLAPLPAAPSLLPSAASTPAGCELHFCLIGQLPVQPLGSRLPACLAQPDWHFWFATDTHICLHLCIHLCHLHSPVGSCPWPLPFAPPTPLPLPLLTPPAAGRPPH